MTNTDKQINDLVNTIFKLHEKGDINGIKKTEKKIEGIITEIYF